MNTIVLAIIVTMSFTAVLTMFFFLYLLILRLKIRGELSETLKLEIEKSRYIYEFIKRRKFVKPENIVVDFLKIHPKNPSYHKALVECTKELKERSAGEYNTLSKIGSFFELSEDSKRFFVSENPTVKQLIKYIFKHEIEMETP
ncbi:MAG: hypothetical protein ISS48_03445 [Candidatus Aenigmarchaeota archaeon]|nr:hypothetical protein [Candidatus Aenigmarchaeota archaeon]